MTLPVRWIVVLVIALLAWPFGSRTTPTDGWTAPGAVDPTNTFMVSKLTGAGPQNQTDHAGFWGGDLGHSFTHRGRTYFVFGDNYTEPGNIGWRSNALAYSTDTDPTDGICFDHFIADSAGMAKEILTSGHNTGGEQTVIPTSGWSDGRRMYLHFQSVQSLLSAGNPTAWIDNYSGFAYSDDDGQNWVKSSAVRWAGTSNFEQAALVAPGDGFLYMFGIPAGRSGGVMLARVPTSRILVQPAWTYWDGGSWTTSETAAVWVVPPTAGELSVRWNSFYKSWLMMYLDVNNLAIVLRAAPSLTGPWDAERTVVTQEEWPTLYLGSIAPIWNDGPDIWFTNNNFVTYEVYWWHTALTYPGSAPLAAKPQVKAAAPCP